MSISGLSISNSKLEIPHDKRQPLEMLFLDQPEDVTEWHIGMQNAQDSDYSGIDLLKNARVLELSATSNITDAALRAINCPPLEVCYLYGCTRVSPEGLVDLMQRHPAIKKVRTPVMQVEASNRFAAALAQTDLDPQQIEVELYRSEVTRYCEGIGYDSDDSEEPEQKAPEVIQPQANPFVRKVSFMAKEKISGFPEVIVQPLAITELLAYPRLSSLDLRSRSIEDLLNPEITERLNGLAELKVVTCRTSERINLIRDLAERLPNLKELYVSGGDVFDRSPRKLVDEQDALTMWIFRKCTQLQRLTFESPDKLADLNWKALLAKRKSVTSVTVPATTAEIEKVASAFEAAGFVSAPTNNSRYNSSSDPLVEFSRKETASL